MDPTDAVQRLIEPSIGAMGYDLVRVRLSGGARPTLQVMAERRDGRAMTVDDCAAISRNVSALLDVEDPIAGSYTLEVSSPGLDRPLVSRGDFARFAGLEVKLESRRLIDGRRRFRGRLIGIDGDAVRIACDGMTAEIPFAEVGKARLVLTQELAAAAMKEREG